MLTYSDEAHCISAWGYDFRVHYMLLGQKIESLRNRTGVSPFPVAAFTATADEKIQNDIDTMLHMRQDRNYYEVCLVNPTNITKKVTWIEEDDAENERERFQKRLFMIGNYVKEHSKEKGVIFCNTKNQVDRVRRYLEEEKIDVPYETFYAADYNDSPSERESNVRERIRKLKKFKNGKTKLVIATGAFGMGINIKNIRYIIHFMSPLTKEDYLQQCGRAGRDGKPAECILFIGPTDHYTFRILLRKKYLLMFHMDYAVKIRKRDRQKLADVLEYYGELAEEGDQENILGEKNKVLNFRSNEEYWMAMKNFGQFVINCSGELHDAVKKGKITYFQSVLLDGAYTLWYNGNRTFSVRELMCTITGSHRLHLTAARKERIEQELETLIRGGYLPAHRRLSGKYVKYDFDQSSYFNREDYNPDAFSLHWAAAQDQRLCFLPNNGILQCIGMAGTEDAQKKPRKKKRDEDDQNRKRTKSGETDDFLCIKFYILRNLERIFQYSGKHSVYTRNRVIIGPDRFEIVPVYQRGYYEDYEGLTEYQKKKRQKKIRANSHSNRIIYSRTPHGRTEEREQVGLFEVLDFFRKDNGKNEDRSNVQSKMNYVHRKVCHILDKLVDFHYIGGYEICTDEHLSGKYQDKRDEVPFMVEGKHIRGVIINN